MRLTIVLTVYNKEPYLHRAFEYLLKQEEVQDGDYEVLAVNDGSTDESLKVIEEYARNNSIVRVLDQNNQGLSMARNNGTNAARGEYVWYVDADDIVSKKAVRLLCDAMETHPDVIPIYAQDEGKDEVRNCISPTVKTGKELILSKKWEQCGVFWVLRKVFLKDNELNFFPGIYHEDAEFTPRMLYAAKSVVVVPQVLYRIYHDPNSITGVPRPKRAFDCLIVADRLYSFIKEHKLQNTDIGQIFVDQAAQMISNGFAVIAHNSKKEQDLFDIAFHSKSYLIALLRIASNRKYRIESYLFKMLPGNYVMIYKILKNIKR